MLKRMLTIGILPLGLLVAMTGIGSAHWVAHEKRTYYGDEYCVSVRSEISHGSGGGYSKSTVRSKKHNPYECAAKKKRYPNNMRAKWTMLFQDWDGWRTCVASNYAKNTQLVDTFSVNRDHGTTTPCGDGRYMNIANASVFIETRWRGTQDVYSSPGHWLPSE